jgi:hypothetical protein
VVEYGNGVGQGAGQLGSSGHGGQVVDVGASLSQLVTDSVHTVAALPPTVLAAGFIAIVVGFLILKRAF